MLFTVGYEGAKLSDFVDTLKTCKVELLVDIRDYPGSRRKGFSKNVLRDHLSEAEIEYEHLGELGDPKEGREAARSGRYDEFRRIFEAHMESKEARLGMDRLAELASDHVVCLLCYERNPKVCHRQIVADRLKNRLNIEVKHIGVQQSPRDSSDDAT